MVISNVSELTCGRTYHNRVRASNGCGTSTNSGTICAVSSSCGPTCGTPTWTAAAINIGIRIPVARHVQICLHLEEMKNTATFI